MNEDFTPADGILAPPMVNGEVVFDAPWHGRVFGMARALAEAGLFQWDDFRACLIDELAGVPETQPFAYYDHFLRALERLLAERNLVAPSALTARFEAYLARPHGHDHAHDH